MSQPDLAAARPYTDEDLAAMREAYDDVGQLPWATNPLRWLHTLAQREQQAREQEREACAIVCDGLCKRAEKRWGNSEYVRGLATGYEAAADALRERGGEPAPARETK